MSTIAPGRLLDIEGVGDPVAVCQTDFEILSEEVFEFTPTYQNGTPTTVIGPPTTGTHVAEERWHDANFAEYRCTVGGTPGTWRQHYSGVVGSEPSSGTIPTGYLIEDASDYNRLKRHAGGYDWVDIYEPFGAAASAVNDVFETLGALGQAGGIYWRSGDDIACTNALTGILRGNGASGPEVISSLTANRIARIGTSGQTLVNSIARDDGSQLSIGADADAAQLTLQVSGGISLIGASTIKTSIGALTIDTGNSLAINFKIGGSNGWYIDSDSKFYVVGSGQIGTTTGNFTIATGAGNGNIILSPHGTGNVGIGTTTIAVRGNPPTTARLDIRDGYLALTDADVNQPTTNWGSAATYGLFDMVSETTGGLRQWGFSDGDATALSIYGIMGTTTPTDTTPVVRFNVGRNTATSFTGIGSSETAFQFYNDSTHILTMLGGGFVGIGATVPTTIVDVASAGTAAMVSITNTSAYTSITEFGLRFRQDSGTGGVLPLAAILSARENTTDGGRQGYLSFFTNNNNPTYDEKARITSDGKFGIGTTGPDRLHHLEIADAVTNAVTYAQRISHITSGTSAAGQGVGVEFEVENSTGSNVIPGFIESTLSTVGASWLGDLILKAADSAGAREVFRGRGSGSAAQLGVLGATPIARQAHIVDADGTLADITTKFNTLLTYVENFGFVATS